MEPLATIAGIGLTMFLLMWLSSQLEEKHGLLKLLSLFFILALLLLLPKTVIDAQTTCEPVLSNTTVSGNLTTYAYSDYCITQDKATNGTFFNAVLWFYRLFIVYVFIYLGYEALMLLNNSFKTRGRR